MSPAVNPNPNDYLRTLLKGFDARLKALETQQNGGVLDNKGVQRVQYGLLKSGDYGFSVTDASGTTTTEILPIYEESDGGNTLSTSTLSYITDGNMPALTAIIGTSGQALLTVNSYIGVTGVAAAQSAGFIGVSIDGGAPTGALNDLLYFSVSSPSAGAVGIAGNQSAQVVLTGLSPGSHTFRPEFMTVGGLTVTFRNRFVQVRPL
jgi:hypothetical protein